MTEPELRTAMLRCRCASRRVSIVDGGGEYLMALSTELPQGQPEQFARPPSTIRSSGTRLTT